MSGKQSVFANEVVVVKTCCPHCGHRFDRASDSSLTETRHPKRDDVSICIECAAILIYTDNEGRLRAAQPVDIEALMQVPAWKEIEKVQFVIREIRRRYRDLQ